MGDGFFQRVVRDCTQELKVCSTVWSLVLRQPWLSLMYDDGHDRWEIWPVMDAPDDALAVGPSAEHVLDTMRAIISDRLASGDGATSEQAMIARKAFDDLCSQRGDGRKA